VDERDKRRGDNGSGTPTADGGTIAPVIGHVQRWGRFATIASSCSAIRSDLDSNDVGRFVGLLRDRPASPIC
jgi:hypothetical protein